MILQFVVVASLLIAGHGTYGDDADESDYACCPEANLFFNRSLGCLTFADSTKKGFIEINKTINLQCSHNMYVLDTEEVAEDQFTVVDGQLVMVNSTMTVEKDRFCVTNKLKDSSETYKLAFVCFPDPDNELDFYTLYGVLSICSVFFLILTLIVYLLVPRLRDLQGWCIMCLCGSLSLGFLFLSSTQLASPLQLNIPRIGKLENLCVISAFGIYFWMLAAFFWMNVVAINVMRSTVFKNPSTPDRTMFMYYTTYGWGMPLIFLITTLIAHRADGNHLKPGFGENSCWFAGHIETWAYFYVPIAIILCMNIVLFAITSLKLWQRTSYDNVTKMSSMKFKFLLYAKLFLVIGLSWIFEVISFAHGKKIIIWYITDIFNALQGVVFFLILVVFRKRALIGLSEVLPIPCLNRLSKDEDEECDDIICHEEASAMTNSRQANFS